MTLIFAHRGASQRAPENTLSAFRLAHKLGAQAIELDVQLCQDNSAFIFHDDDLDRTSNGHGPLALQTAQALAKFSAGDWFQPPYLNEPIPTLDAVLDLIKSLGIYTNIELKPDRPKADRLVAQVLAALKRHQIDTSQILLSSFLPEIVQGLQKEAPMFSRALLLHAPHSEAIAFAQHTECVSINPHVSLVTRDFIQQAHDHQLNVFSYTINDRQIAQDLVNQGLDGFFTDDADLYAGV